MVMEPTLAIATVLSSVSILLLLGLTAVWIRNYRMFGSSMILGLLAFGVVLLAENVLALYFFFSTNMLYTGDPFAQRMLLVLRTLQLSAIAFLAYVTIK
ncbi:hypothetical protein E2L06_12915 [Haloterrigena sp. H1]|uniref:hypothetical protein n=1 Tax=Haloterrigena sp. H1 TaxID=2552943 RepID=UPI00110E6CCB|nr:hypothetical protein E2L06_12915 [Haloterrigena sp. H1]